MVTIIFKEKIMKPRKEKALRLEKKVPNSLTHFVTCTERLENHCKFAPLCLFTQKKCYFSVLDARNLLFYFWINGTSLVSYAMFTLQLNAIYFIPSSIFYSSNNRVLKIDSHRKHLNSDNCILLNMRSIRDRTELIINAVTSFSRTLQLI